MDIRLIKIVFAALFLLTGCSALDSPPEAGGMRPGGEATTVRRSDMVAALLGVWVQDDSGPILTSRKRYHFKPDGSYEFVFTSRNTGSLDQRVLAREEGTFTAEAGRLTLSPDTGPARSFPWRIEKDPYVGDIRLVMVLPDRMLDIYYQE